MADTDQEATLSRIAAAIIDTGEIPWQFRAECGTRPELMDATRPPEVFEALAVCAKCPVTEDCRSWADSELAYVGVAGGRVYTRTSRRRAGSHQVRRAKAG